MSNVCESVPLHFEFDILRDDGCAKQKAFDSGKQASFYAFMPTEFTNTASRNRSWGARIRQTRQGREGVLYGGALPGVVSHFGKLGFYWHTEVVSGS